MLNFMSPITTLLLSKEDFNYGASVSTLDELKKLYISLNYIKSILTGTTEDPTEIFITKEKPNFLEIIKENFGPEYTNTYSLIKAGFSIIEVFKLCLNIESLETKEGMLDIESEENSNVLKALWLCCMNQAHIDDFNIEVKLKILTDLLETPTSGNYIFFGFKSNELGRNVFPDDIIKIKNTFERGFKTGQSSSFTPQRIADKLNSFRFMCANVLRTEHATKDQGLLEEFLSNLTPEYFIKSVYSILGEENIKLDLFSFQFKNFPNTHPLSTFILDPKAYIKFYKTEKSLYSVLNTEPSENFKFIAKILDESCEGWLNLLEEEVG